MKRRVVVTGLGAVTPVGNNVTESWANIVAGKSGAKTIDLFDPTGYAVTFSAPVKEFDPSHYISAREARRMDKFIQYGLVAGLEALDDSGLEVTDENATRIGAMIGSGIGGLPGIEESHSTLLNKGPGRISPFFVPGAIINMVAGQLSIMRGLKGPNLAAVTACASGTHSIGLAARLIAYGDADVMVAGGAEMATCPTGIGGFAAVRALSKRNDDPEAASRPWDQDRDGFVLGDGAGVLVLEEYEHAKKRGAKIYCELTGFGMSSDAYHITSPTPDGSGAMQCMVAALNDAGIDASEIDYINAHGTSTPVGDVMEIAAVKGALGDHIYKTAISSTKSMTGHLLGAAGGIEAVFTILAIRDQIAPPTINLDNPAEECEGINLVPNTAQKMEINYALSNSFGFGGTNGSLLFKKIDE
ncbi:beta-ketoacyl-ACP synthase II [Ignatzschineria sp. RMDPL8A]|uniref:beta-ketoacyl-ACP synthase II n=1 Tax=Ignatzschineria sp. RMDPL8A TaxID=2999236 RepID=UPI0024465F82|nr:beta-ketoacyl-ACP synthase II [Ignatzschineria sp. RMDPL8A]MDG9729898.1 beta-ketoacyl-ACP synthase II [Ignatzschineria sp. RMDPL8A]